MRTLAIILSIIVIILTSCGPTYHLRRAKYHERMAVALGADVNPDTVYIEKVIKMPGVKKDSIVYNSLPGDTVYIHKDRLSIKYVKLKGDSVFIRGECKDSVITIKEPVYINKTIKAESKLPWWVYLVFGVCALVITVLCFRR